MINLNNTLVLLEIESCKHSKDFGLNSKDNLEKRRALTYLHQCAQIDQQIFHKAIFFIIVNW